MWEVGTVNPLGVQRFYAMKGFPLRSFPGGLGHCAALSLGDRGVHLLFFRDWCVI